MSTMNVYLATPEEALRFVNTVSKYPFDVDLGSGNVLIDAKSIIGVMGVGLGHVMTLEMHTEHPEQLCEELLAYRA